MDFQNEGNSSFSVAFIHDIRAKKRYGAGLW
jgi:hypothetical protein